MATSRTLRSPLAVTISVWRALFLREAVSRLARDPMAWFWLLAEPVGHIALLMWLFVVGFRQRTIVGGDASVFIMFGVLAFFLPRNMMNRGIAAVDTGGALYAYRQVKPVDIVLARVGLESLLASIVFFIVWAGAALLGFPVYLADPLSALFAMGALWLAGMGLALTLSVVANLNVQVGHFVRLLMGPLYIFSAIMYPTYAVPPAMRDVVLLNPLVHGVESLRLAFMPGYQLPAGISLLYLFQFAVVMLFLGLVLHARFQNVLMTK